MTKELWIQNGMSLLYQDHDFGRRMSLQMVQYKCSNLQYPGDEKMRKNTQMNKKRHGTSDFGLIECDNHIKRVSYLLYLDEKQ